MKRFGWSVWSEKTQAREICRRTHVGRARKKPGTACSFGGETRGKVFHPSHRYAITSKLIECWMYIYGLVDHARFHLREKSVSADKGTELKLYPFFRGSDKTLCFRCSRAKRRKAESCRWEGCTQGRNIKGRERSKRGR